MSSWICQWQVMSSCTTKRSKCTKSPARQAGERMAERLKPGDPQRLGQILLFRPDSIRADKLFQCHQTDRSEAYREPSTCGLNPGYSFPFPVTPKPPPSSYIRCVW